MTEMRDKTVKTLTLFKEMLDEMELQYLWRDQKVEEDFVKSFINMSFDLL